MPRLVELQERLAAEEDFEFVSVSCGVGLAYIDSSELLHATAAYARHEGISFPIYSDLSGNSRGALEDVTGESLGYPISLVLDRDQSIRGFWLGYEKGVERELLGVVSGLLQE